MINASPRSYNVHRVVEGSTGMCGARSDSASGEGDTLVLPRFNLQMGKKTMSYMFTLIDQWEDYNGVSSIT